MLGVGEMISGKSVIPILSVLSSATTIRILVDLFMSTSIEKHFFSNNRKLLNHILNILLISFAFFIVVIWFSVFTNSNETGEQDVGIYTVMVEFILIVTGFYIIIRPFFTGINERRFSCVIKGEKVYLIKRFSKQTMLGKIEERNTNEKQNQKYILIPIKDLMMEIIEKESMETIVKKEQDIITQNYIEASYAKKVSAWLILISVLLFSLISTLIQQGILGSIIPSLFILTGFFFFYRTFPIKYLKRRKKGRNSSEIKDTGSKYF